MLARTRQTSFFCPGNVFRADRKQLAGISGKTEGGSFDLCLPYARTNVAFSGQCFLHTTVYFETTRLALSIAAIHFFLSLLFWGNFYTGTLSLLEAQLLLQFETQHFSAIFHYFSIFIL